ncbi:SprT family zinc-dependent metalloprotease [Pelagicoccus sp. SDUM812003]|uniref:M48 family metallopeptidase n=1 Tax=Pelagicoccus sp. SDUM812003 TaxID=3041267 RepID=UPI0028103464|nr:SprT family zinc-dependent metalloprotease [Pelagicoccus sp. SDUM812003]MDQ8204445.1 SprT family zinc-dependent metalloprotease [Pelagicoccus sp. SDUM812003]
MSRTPAAEAFYQTAPLREEDVVFKRHARARRYLARIDSDGEIALTVPSGGNKRSALVFANMHRDWLREEQRKALSTREVTQRKAGLRFGDSIMWRGKLTPIVLEKDLGRPVLCLARERVYIADEAMDLTRPLKEYLKEKAKKELTRRVGELAERYAVKVAKVSIRDPKTRWGSCSNSRTISLSWRLLLTPLATRDYVIIHELMHLKRFDHSPAFWRLVEKACPNFRTHERWLDENQSELTW